MTKPSRRLSRLTARERRRKRHDAEMLRRRFRRRGAIVAVAAGVILVGSGMASDWASIAGSSVASAFEAEPELSAVGADLTSAQFITIEPKGEEEIRARLERLVERRQEIEDSSREVVRAQRVVPAMEVGTTAAEIAAAWVSPLVPARDQLAPMAEVDGPWRRALERFDADGATLQAER